MRCGTLRQADKAFEVVFLQRILDFPGLAERIVRKPFPVIRALTGFDLDRRRQVIETIFRSFAGNWGANILNMVEKIFYCKKSVARSRPSAICEAGAALSKI